MKIAVLTTSRSDYGATKWLLRKLVADSFFETIIIASGNHYCAEFGNTYQEIEADGFVINHPIPLVFSDSSAQSKAAACGVLQAQAADIFTAEQPDLLCVLGDRFEILPVCLTAVLYGIPIAHVSGGDITEGAIDDRIRHAVSKLANLHFPGNAESKKILEQMGELPSTVFNVGELGIEGILGEKKIPRQELANDLNLNAEQPWILLTYHSETNLPLADNLRALGCILNFLGQLKGYQVLATYPNADIGHIEIVEALRSATQQYPAVFHLTENLGPKRFSSFLQEADFMIGNSSSAFFEAPSTRTPAINVGSRQKGRLLPRSVITCPANKDALEKAYAILGTDNFRKQLESYQNPYAQGCASDQIVSVLKQIDLSLLNPKKFNVL